MKWLNRFDTVMYNILETCSHLTTDYEATDEKPLPTTNMNKEKRLIVWCETVFPGEVEVIEPELPMLPGVGHWKSGEVCVFEWQ